HMPVGVIVDEAAIQPHDLRDSEGLAKALFNIRRAPFWISIPIEQTLPRREAVPAPIDVQRPSLENPRKLCAWRVYNVRNACAHLGVVIEDIFLPPAIEFENAANERPAIFNSKDRSCVPQPDIPIRNSVVANAQMTQALADDEFVLFVEHEHLKPLASV